MKWHKMTPFPTKYCLATQEELEVWTKKSKFNPYSLDENTTGVLLTYGGALIVLVKPKQKHWEIVDTLIHESVHVFQRAMEYVGESSTGAESQAYHIASIATNLLKDYHTKYG